MRKRTIRELLKVYGGSGSREGEQKPKGGSSGQSDADERGGSSGTCGSDGTCCSSARTGGGELPPMTSD
jgi:hypothetical protein